MVPSPFSDHIPLSGMFDQTTTGGLLSLTKSIASPPYLFELNFWTLSVPFYPAVGRNKRQAFACNFADKGLLSCSVINFEDAACLPAGRQLQI